ncbi:MAG: hypothetical protein ABJF23_01165 [Bryobacteraceae bacterium]
MDFPTSAHPTDFNKDVSVRSLGEIMLAFEENNVRHKALRLRSAALVASRLAKQIGAEEYAVLRQESKNDMVEVQRCRTNLLNELAEREHFRFGEVNIGFSPHR